MDESRDFKPQAIFEVIDFGPLKVTGNFVLKDTKRNIEIKGEEMLLCRCGKSKNKPYCDGSHEK